MAALPVGVGMTWGVHATPFHRAVNGIVVVSGEYEAPIAVQPGFSVEES